MGLIFSQNGNQSSLMCFSYHTYYFGKLEIQKCLPSLWMHALATQLTVQGDVTGNSYHSFLIQRIRNQSIPTRWGKTLNLSPNFLIFVFNPCEKLHLNFKDVGKSKHVLYTCGWWDDLTLMYCNKVGSSLFWKLSSIQRKNDHQERNFTGRFQNYQLCSATNTAQMGHIGNVA